MPILFGLLAASILIPFGAYLLGERRKGRFKSMLVINLVSFFGILLFATVFLFSGSASAAETASAAAVVTATSDFSKSVAFFSAAMVTSVATIGTGIAVGQAASAALGALSENDKIMGKAIIFVALAEGIAIYGLLISFTILGRV